MMLAAINTAPFCFVSSTAKIVGEGFAKSQEPAYNSRQDFVRQMFNLHKTWVEFPCPRCEFPNSISMREIRFGLTILCRGCKVTIRLDPADGGIRKVDRMLQELEQSLTKTININIKF